MILTQKQQAVAMVSPMPSDVHSQLSESSHSASTGQHSNSSESSVIYKPSSESGSEHPLPIIPNRKEPQGYLMEGAEPSTTASNSPTPNTQDSKEPNVAPKIEQEVEVPPKDPDKPVNNDSPIHPQINSLPITNLSNLINGHTVNHIRESSLEEEPTSMNVQPMRPLLRGYCSNLTLPARGPRGHYPQRIQPDGGSDYCEIAIANGYLSDGEVLRNPIVRNEICDGYMSEGGTLYARRLQTMPAHLTNG